MNEFYEIHEDKIIEGLHELAISRRADIIVAGGGPAGIVAAISAARTGVRVILIESNSFLGGVATSVLMAALVGSRRASGISLELINRMAEKGGAPKWNPQPGYFDTTPFDPEIFKETALEMVREAGVSLMLYTLVSRPIIIGDKVKGVIIENKSGRSAVLGERVIDCTGDADLAYAAGASCMMGRESDQKMRPFALLFRLGGININKIVQYVKDNPEELQPQFREGTLHKVGNEEIIIRISGFYKLVEEAKKNEELYPECHYFRLENLWLNRGTAICNTSRIYYVDGTDANDLTKGEIAGREQIKKLVSFAKKYIPGCENAFLIDVAPHMGVRETRRIIGEYSLTNDDAYSDARFDDAIMTVNDALVKRPVPIELDVHMPDPIEGSMLDLLERFPERVPREKHRELCYQKRLTTCLCLDVQFL